MIMKFPHFLAKGSHIGLVAPAGKTDKETVERAITILNNRGYRVIVGDHALNQHYQMAGKDHDRLNDLQSFMNRSDIDAIFCIRGGYGTIRIIDQLDFTHFITSPKWIVGFSDITVLHSCLQNKYQIASIHGIMPKGYQRIDNSVPDFEFLIKNLEGEFPSIQIEPHVLNKKGKSEGHLWGGNLSLLHALRGTPYDFDPEGKILFIEDIGDYLYRIDRVIHNFKLGGIFEKISGLIVGQFTNMLDNDIPFGQSAYEIIYDAVKDADYPVIFNFPAGHESPNYPLVFGKTVSLDVNQQGSLLIV